MNAVLVEFWEIDTWTSGHVRGYELMTSVPDVGDVVRIADRTFRVRARVWDLYPKTSPAAAGEFATTLATGQRCCVHLERVAHVGITSPEAP